MAKPSIADRIRAARESQVKVGEWEFTIRRPTDLRVAEWQSQDEADESRVRRLVAECVVGWSNVKEQDLFPGGGDQEVPFDSEAFVAWAEDRLEVVTAIYMAVFAAIHAWREKNEGDRKNS